MLTSSWLVAQPTITSFSPTSGAAGSSCTLTVTGFNGTTTISTDNVFRLGGVTCSVVSQNLNSSGNGTIVLNIPHHVNTARFVGTNKNSNSRKACMSIRAFVVKYPSSVGYNYRTGAFATSVGYVLPSSLYYGHNADGSNLHVADINDDGKPDILAYSGTVVRLFTNTSTSGTISFSSSDIITGLPSANGSYRSVIAVDYDNDGDLDIITRIYEFQNATVKNISIYEKGPSGYTRQVNDNNASFDMAYYDLRTIDFDGDGLLDVLGASARSSTNIGFKNTFNSGTSAFGKSNQSNVSSIVNSSSYAFDMANLNGDNKLDVVYASNNSFGMNNTTSGSGLSFSSTGTFGSSSTSRQIVAGDLDNDGFDDIVCGRVNPIQVFRNNNNSTFSNTSFSSINGDVNLADFNNDGLLDIICTNNSGVDVHINNNTSPLSFTKHSVASTNFRMQYDVSIVDFDGDGYPDLLGAVDNNSNFFITRNVLSTLPYASVTESLSSFTYCSGAANSTKSISVSGGALSQDLFLTVPSGFAISTNSAGPFTSTSATLTRSGSTVANTTVYIKLTGSTSHSGNLVIKEGSSGAELYSKAVSGVANLVPTISGNEYVLDGSPTTLTGAGTAASANPWVSSNTSVVTVSSVGLISAASPFSAGKATITYTDNNTCSATKEITTVKLTQALSSFTRTSGATAVAQTFTLNSGQTSSNIIIQAPSGYEVSTDGTTYSSSVTLNSGSGSVSATIYVRMSGSAVGTTYSGNVSIKIGSAITVQSIAVSGSIESTTYTLKSGKSGDINNLSSWEDASGNSPTSWDAPRTFTLPSTGTFTFTSATTSWPMTGTLVVPAGATLNIGSGQTLTVSGTGSLTNSGTIGTSSGSLTIAGTATYTNSGTLNIGTLNYTGSAAQTLGGTTTIGTLNNDNTGGVTFTAAQTITTLDVDSGSDLTLGGTTTVTDLTMTNGDLNLNGKSLTVTGTLTTNANAKFAAGTSGANQTGSQLTLDPSTTFTGNIYFDETANTFQKIVIGDKVTGTFANSVNLRGGDGTSTPGILEVQSGGTLAIANGKKLTLKSGQINAMLSLPSAATGILSGDITVERAHMGARGWRIYTHPFNSSINLSQMADDIEMIGSGGTAAGFYSNASTNASAFYYDYTVVDANRETTTQTDLGWKPFTKANDANAEPWAKSNPIIVYNCGAVRNGNGFFNPFAATHQDGIVSLDYTVGGSFNVNDGGSVSVNANPTGSWYYLCNPYTAPVKLKDITGFNSTNVENTVYYWRQRRASISNLNPFFNRLPADWQAVDWSAADNALAIPANGAILVKLKLSGGITFTFDENDKQLTDFTKIMGATLGGGTGYSNWNDMFTEVYQPTLGDNSFLFGLNIADTAEVDNVMIFDVEGAKTSFDENDGIKYKNDGFPNVYTVSSDKKTLSNDKRNITERLNAGEESVEIPLVITNRQDLPFSKLTLFAKEVNTDLVVYVKNNQTNELTPMGLWDRFDVNFEGDKKAPIEKYSLVFKAQVSNNTEMLETSMVKVYPNPSNDQITILLDATVKTDQYEILDLMGRSVQSGTISKKQINVRDLSVGHYIIKVGNFTTRFIKN